MKVSGYKISGGSYVGRQTLATIGTLIFWYDYRFNANIEDTDRVASWGDLGPNQLTLTAEGFRRFYAAADGFGDGGNGVTVQMTSPHKEALNKLHLGNPFLWFAVVSYPAAPSSLNRLTYTAEGANVPGADLEVVNTTGVFRSIVQNDSDTAIVNNSTAAIPTNEFILLMRYYYGSGTGSNNAKSVVKSTVSTFTSNPTFGTANCNRLLVGKNSAGTGDNQKIKCIGAYDLTGKSIAEVDAFVATFIATLKTDTEYSGLTTP